MAAALELEELGVRKQFCELTAGLDRDDHVGCPMEDQRRNGDLPWIDVRHGLVAPHFDDARCLLRLCAQEDVSAPASDVVAVGLGEAGADELVDGRWVIRPARFCECAAALAAASTGRRGEDEPVEPLRAAGGCVLRDRTSLRFAREAAALDSEHVEDAGDVVDHRFHGDQCGIDGRLARAAVVIRDAAPTARGQLRNRLLPYLPAPRPAADRDQRARAITEDEGVESNAVDIEEHEPSCIGKPRLSQARLSTTIA